MPAQDQFLVAPKGRWTGTLGQPYTPEEFEKYVKSLGQPPMWVQFMTLHNTGAPSMASWKANPKTVPAGLERTRQRLRNVTHGYQQQGWRGGPHLFIDDDFIWTFTPLHIQGTHSPSWNKMAWGIEVVGDFDREQVSQTQWANSVAAFAILHEWRGLDPETIRSHKEDKRTTHDCPGKFLHGRKDEFIDSVKRAMLDDGEHVVVHEDEEEDDAKPTPAPVASRTHVVKQGDTFWGVAHRYGLTVDELKGFNRDNEVLNPGEVLMLGPPPREAITTSGVAATSITNEGLKTLGSVEAYVDRRYRDGEHWSWGFGFQDPSLTADARFPIEVGMKQFRAKAMHYVGRVLANVKVPLTAQQLDGLTLFDYNTGAIDDKDGSVAGKFNAGDITGGVAAMAQYNKVTVRDSNGQPILKNGKKQKKIHPGLQARREREAAIILKGDYGDNSSFLLYQGEPHGPMAVKPTRVQFPATF